MMSLCYANVMMLHYTNVIMLLCVYACRQTCLVYACIYVGIDIHIYVGRHA